MEKINAAIEEQAFLIKMQQNSQEITLDSLSKIESNLTEIELLARQEGVIDLVDNPTINDVRKNIALYRRNT